MLGWGGGRGNGRGWGGIKVGARRARALRNIEWGALKGGGRKDGEVESLKGGMGGKGRGVYSSPSLSVRAVWESESPVT